MEQMQAAAPKAKPVVRYDHIMLDLETLGTTADSAILSIGAVKFNLNGEMDDAAFYAICTIGSQPKRHINGDTLAWWMTQNDDAQKVFTSGDKMPLERALLDLKGWVEHDDYLLWSNGADFDIPIINHAMRAYNIAPLVKFWNHRCFRTLKNEYSSCPKPPFEGAQHNALMDAIHQAKWVQAIYEFKRNSPAPKGFAASVVKAK